MIRLYAKNETTFGHNEHILQPIRCEVAEDANGQFELDYESLPNGEIQTGSIIQAPTPRGSQLFRVYKPTHTLQKTKAKARHISYDLMQNWLEDVRPSVTSGSGAINSILGGTLYPHRFSGSSTVATIATSYFIRKNPIQALIGAENSLVSRWGGYLQRDNFVLKHIPEGRDLGYEIRYGKNLKGISVEIDDSAVVTKLMPTWVNEENNVVQYLPERYIDSPIIGAYTEPRVAEYRVSVPENTEDPAGYVREKAMEQFSVANIDKPLINYKVDFIALRDLPEYREFVWIEEIDLYDIVNIIVSPMGLELSSNVIRYEYDCLKERFKSIEIGNFSNSLARNTSHLISQVDAKIDTKAEEIFAKQLEATRKITGVTGGNVLMRFDQMGQPYETLWMDTDDVATAKNLVRINKAGIGFSQNGINGPYSVAITNDGHIVADFIDLGTLNAAIIKAGVLADASGKNSLNMASGAFNLANKIWYNPSTNEFRIDAKLLVDEITGTSLKLAGKNVTLDGNTAVLGTFRVSGDALFGVINAQTINVTNMNADNLNRGTVGTSISNTSGTFSAGWKNARMDGSATGVNGNSSTFYFDYASNRFVSAGRITAQPSGNVHEFQLNGIYMRSGGVVAEMKVWGDYVQMSGDVPFRFNSGIQMNGTVELRGNPLSLGSDGNVKWK